MWRLRTFGQAVVGEGHSSCGSTKRADEPKGDRANRAPSWLFVLADFGIIQGRQEENYPHPSVLPTWSGDRFIR